MPQHPRQIPIEKVSGGTMGCQEKSVPEAFPVFRDSQVDCNKHVKITQEILLFSYNSFPIETSIFRYYNDVLSANFFMRSGL